MRVLHLPVNVASQMSVYVRALRDIGVDARGLASETSHYVDDRGVDVFPLSLRPRSRARAYLNTALWHFEVFKAITWADVVHWRWGEADPWARRALRYIAWLRKPGLVDFCGTDVRIREIAAADNPYVGAAYERGEMAGVDRETSVARQALFAERGFRCILRRFELVPYIQQELFGPPIMTRAPVLLSDYVPRYPEPDKTLPLVVHCPSKKGTKGTSAVEDALERVRRTSSFELELVHGVSRDKALDAMRRADVVLDQFVIGEYGNAALEAMALGKPTVCYLKPSVASQLPPDCPIVNANKEDLAEVVCDLLKDGLRRHEIGRRSRAYVEKYHDAHKLARELAEIYQELLDAKRRPKGAHAIC